MLKNIEIMEVIEMEYVMLNNGVKMPMNGFGVFQISDFEQCEKAVLDAVRSGYRMIDTAASYGNEEAVGKAIEECGVVRSDLFITTKLWVQDAGYEKAKKAFETSMEKLGLEYLDLYLLHQPLGDYYGAYRAMEELYKEGRIRAIGVCNFYPERLMDLCLHAEVIPAVNQVELHPFFQQEQALEVMKEFEICPQAWAPLNEGKQNIFSHPVLMEIGEKYGKSPAQVVLRWNIQRGVAVIPKSVHQYRMKQNLDVWDFTLSKEDIEKIKELDLGHSEIIDHSNPEIVRMICGRRIHE